MFGKAGIMAESRIRISIIGVMVTTVLTTIVIRTCEHLVLPRQAFGGETPVQKLPFQGRLLVPGGAPVAEGNYRVVFSLYDAPVGGTALWSSGETSLTVRRSGIFNVLLGSGDTPLPDIDFSGDIYLGIRVDDPHNGTLLGDEPEMVPRIPVVPGLYAHRTGRVANADKLDGFDWSAILVDGSHDPSAALIRQDRVQKEGFFDALVVTEDMLSEDLREVIARDNVPPGTVCLWSGAVLEIPTGWFLCDGSNGTPDLTDRFVIHADADVGGINNVGDVGGEHSHTLTVDEMPRHQHSIDLYANNEHFNIRYVSGCMRGELTKQEQTTPTGGSAPHENRPKYYALAFIMKGY